MEAEHRRAVTDLCVVECPIGLWVGGRERMCVHVYVHTRTYICARVCRHVCVCVPICDCRI